MDLSQIPAIGAAHAEKLTAAGVTSVSHLAVLADVAPLAASTGIDAARLEAFRDAARAHVEQLLEEADLHEPRDLAKADPQDVAERTGLPVEHVLRYQAIAREASAPVVPPPQRDKVVLNESSPTATVFHQGESFYAVPIVTVRGGDNEAAVLARHEGPAVLLKERSPTASAKLRGAVVTQLPLYKEVFQAGTKKGEMRVRVAEIRDRPDEEERRVPVGEPEGRKRRFRPWAR